MITVRFLLDKFLQLYIVLIILNSRAYSKLLGLEKGSACSGGRCEIVTNCSTVVNFKKTKPDLCDFEGKIPIICCPFEGNLTKASELSSTTTSQPSASIQVTEGTNQPLTQFSSYQVGDIAEKKCKEYSEEVCKYSKVRQMRQVNQNVPSFEHVVVGGSPSQPKDLTFMVLLGYGDQNKRAWECGGSLISKRWVLSAAHCTNHSRLGRAKWFRVGELVLRSMNDDASPVDMTIVEIVKHPNYGKEPGIYNDIALFKSEYELGFNIYVQPICLETYLPDVRNKPTAAGWGTTEFGGAKSSALLQVELDFVPTMSCKDQYGTSKLIPKGIDQYTQMCAGKPGKDTCTGDSGGPLFQSRGQSGCLRSQIGITSFGRGCGIHPGVYTFLYNYTEWIEKIVWPNEIKQLEKTKLPIYDYA